MSIRDNLGSGSNGGVLDSLEEIEANTTPGKSAGALAVKELKQSLSETDGKADFSTDIPTLTITNGTIITKEISKVGNVVTGIVTISLTSKVGVEGIIFKGVEACNTQYGGLVSIVSLSASNFYCMGYIFGKEVHTMPEIPSGNYVVSFNYITK